MVYGPSTFIKKDAKIQWSMVYRLKWSLRKESTAVSSGGKLGLKL